MFYNISQFFALKLCIIGDAFVIIRQIMQISKLCKYDVIMNFTKVARDFG